jgi:hypothetical protein
MGAMNPVTPSEDLIQKETEAHKIQVKGRQAMKISL